MSKIIACIDGSLYSNSVCVASAWVSARTNCDISLLHVIMPHSDMASKGDLTGSIGLGAKSELLKELTEIDEARGKIELKKSYVMLERAKEELALKGISEVEVLNRHGHLFETISELEAEIALVVMGKRGEHADCAPNHLGSNLERVARSIHQPILVVSEELKPIKRFLIAYDGSVTSQKALDYVINNPLLKGLECHLLKVAEETEDSKSALQQAEEKLESACFEVVTHLVQGDVVSDVVSKHIADNAIDLLVIGAYGHSKIRSMIWGSTTTSLIKESNIPLLLLR